VEDVDLFDTFAPVVNWEISLY